MHEFYTTFVRKILFPDFFWVGVGWGGATELNNLNLHAGQIGLLPASRLTYTQYTNVTDGRTDGRTDRHMHGCHIATK